MDQETIKEYLRTLTNKQLVEFLAELLQQRRSDEGLESEYLQAHWCIAEVSRLKSDNADGWEDWNIELLARHDNDEYPKGWNDEASLSQSGVCKECGTSLLSWAKKITCPVCGAQAYAS